MNTMYKMLSQQVGKESDKVYIRFEKSVRETKVIDEDDVYRFYLNLINMIINADQRKGLINVLNYLKETEADTIHIETIKGILDSLYTDRCAHI